MNIVLLGYPGSGKGTQARKVADKLGVVHVSFGDIFWNEVKKKTHVGLEFADSLATGCLLPDWLVLAQLKERFDKERRGLLFDGFPCTIEQAEGLDSWLAARATSLSAVILLKLSEADATKRAVGRLVCNDCGAIFNKVTKLPFMENLCDSCGGKLSVRDDDKPDAVKKRLLAFRDQTEQLISYYRSNEEFFEINAAQSIETVTSQILAALKTK